jgi:hypothetical protein
MNFDHQQDDTGDIIGMLKLALALAIILALVLVAEIFS